MRIGGYSKLTLQDYPGQVAAICFTVGCQLRCPYCHNAELALSDEVNNNAGAEDLTAEFLSYLEKRKEQLDGVVISGGEPLLQNDLQDFLFAIKKMGLKVKLDTNGFLSEKLKKIIDLKLADYVALDFKNCRQYLAETVGWSEPERQGVIDTYYNNWLESLANLRKNNIPFELRTTVVRELHSFEALQQMATTICDGECSREPWFLQSFVKNRGILCDVTKKGNTDLSSYSGGEMEAMRLVLLQQVPAIQCR